MYIALDKKNLENLGREKKHLLNLKNKALLIIQNTYTRSE